MVNFTGNQQIKTTGYFLPARLAKRKSGENKEKESERRRKKGPIICGQGLGETCIHTLVQKVHSLWRAI